MTTSIAYHPQYNLIGRFVDHAKLGLGKEIQDHSVNLPERLGNAILWTAEDLPGILLDAIKIPRVATVALTALGLLSNSFLFYPAKTWVHLKAFVHSLPLPSFGAVWFASYIYTSTLIVGYGLRTFGRFSNAELMKSFYKV